MRKCGGLSTALRFGRDDDSMGIGFSPLTPRYASVEMTISWDRVPPLTLRYAPVEQDIWIGGGWAVLSLRDERSDRSS